MCTLVLPHAGKYDSLFEKPGTECSILRACSEDGLVCIFGEQCGSWWMAEEEGGERGKSEIFHSDAVALMELHNKRW